jgi:hypothetical protein
LEGLLGKYDQMNIANCRRLAAQIAISLAVAAITPAAAAGLVEGVKVAANSVDDATSLQSVVPDDAVAPAPTPDMNKERIATAEPKRLSPLAGTDAAAWASARSIPERHAHKPNQ